MPLKNETIIQLKKSELHAQCEICCSSVNMTFDSFLFENCAYRYTNCIQLDLALCVNSELNLQNL